MTGIEFQIYTTLFHHKYGMVVEKQAINKTLNYNTLTKHQCQTTDKSPFAELAYFIRNFFMSGIYQTTVYTLL